MNKCIKGESCLHCDTDYCRFKDEVAELKAENERLKRENQIITGMYNSSSNRFDKLYNSLQEIRAIAIHEIKELTDSAINGGRYLEIIDKINEAIGVEE